MDLRSIFGFPSKKDLAAAKELRDSYKTLHSTGDGKLSVDSSEIMQEKKFKNDLKLGKELMEKNVTIQTKNRN